MKKFILHGEMADLFGSNIELDVSTPNEAIRGLCANFPSFRKYVIEKSSSGVNYQFIDKKDNKYDSYCGHIILKEEEYDIVASPEGYAGIGAFFGSPLGAGIANAALGYGMQKLTNKLTKDLIQHDDVPEYEIIQTNSYIYSQNENKTEQGSPIPVIYGQLRVGTKVINSSVENYDYDFEDAFIYPNPPEASQRELIHGGQFSFVLPIDFDDYRDETDLDSFNTYSSEGKRSLSFGSNGAKNFDPNNNNESQAENYDLGGNEYGAAHISKVGASSRRPLKRSTGNSSYKDNASVRPYVFPVDGSLDQLMRPNGRRSLCVERTEKANIATSECLAWVGNNSLTDQMEVRDRGDFQKLESIGIYKSLEVLSEGPIAGLALPISNDINQDTGPVTYPLESTDIGGSQKTIKVNPLKYHDYSTSSLCELMDYSHSTTQESSSLVILSSGSDYQDENGNLLNGQITVLGNDPVDRSHKVSIKVQKPGNNYAAEIQDANFDDENPNYFTNTSEDLFLSDNRIFIVNPIDGELILNSNSSNNPFSLDSKFYNSDGSISLTALEEQDPPLNKWPNDEDEIDFFAGENYPNKTFEYTVEPDNEILKLEYDVGRSSHVIDIYSKAQCLDLGALLGHDVAGQTPTSTYREFERYTEADDNEIPGAVDPDGNPYNWQDMCRIYLHGGTLNLSKSDLETAHYIPVGYLYRKDGLPFNPNTDPTKGGNSNWGTPPEEYGNKKVIFHGKEISQNRISGPFDDNTRAQLYLRITTEEYLGMRDVPDTWKDWTNWYMLINGKYYQVYEYSQEHVLIERSADGYPRWSNIQTYEANGKTLVAYGNDVGETLLYTPKIYIEGDPDIDSFEEWQSSYDYPKGTMVKYNGQAYKSKNIIRGNPDFTIINPTTATFNRYNNYQVYNPSALFDSPQETNYSVSNTVFFETGSRPQGEYEHLFEPEGIYYYRDHKNYRADPERPIRFTPFKAVAQGGVVADKPNTLSYLDYTGIIYQAIEYIDPIINTKNPIVQDWHPIRAFSEGDYVQYLSWDHSKSTRYDYDDARDMAQRLTNWAWIRQIMNFVNTDFDIYDINGQDAGYDLEPDENVYRLTEDYNPPLAWQSGQEYNVGDYVYIFDEDVITEPSRDVYNDLQHDKEQREDPYSFFEYTGTGQNWGQSPTLATGDSWVQVGYSYLDTISPSGLRSNESAAGHPAFELYYGYSYANGINSSKTLVVDYHSRSPYYDAEYNPDNLPFDDEVWEEFPYRNPFDYEYNRLNPSPSYTQQPFSGYWREVPINELTPDSDPSNWEHLPVDNQPPPVPMEDPWSDSRAYQSGECVLFGQELYTATTDIDGLVDASTLPFWEEDGVYGYEEEDGTGVGIIIQVQYNKTAYQLKIDPATNDYYEIIPENDDQFLTDEQVDIIYQSDTTKYDFLAPDGDGIYTSVPVDRTVTINNVEVTIDDSTTDVDTLVFAMREFVEYIKQPTPDNDSTRWEAILPNPSPDSDTSRWQVSAEWKPFTNTTVENFERSRYGIHADYSRREGIIQNPDPSPKNKGGLMGAIGGLFGGKVKWIRQSGVRSHRDAITRNSRGWQSIINGDQRSMSISELLIERYEQASDELYPAKYATKIKKLGKSKMKYSSAAGTTLYYSQGPDFNEAILKELDANLSSFDSNADYITKRESRFRNSRQSNSYDNLTISYSVSFFSNPRIVLTNDAQNVQMKAYNTNQTRFLRFSIGSNGVNMLNDLDFYVDESFPGYMLQGGTSINTLDNVKMFVEGFNPKDDSTRPYGFYQSNLGGSSTPHYPRVTVFIMRRRASGAIDFCPTLIEALAEVDAVDGVIKRVYLLNLPERPVFDIELLGEGSDGFCHIYPQDLDSQKPYYACKGKYFQDIGVYLKIDASHGYQKAMFNTVNGEIDRARTPEDEKFGLYASWGNHIQYDGVGVGGGLEMPICVNNQSIQVKQFGNVSAEITLHTEHSLSPSSIGDSFSDWVNKPSVVDTGRVKNFTISKRGSGYGTSSMVTSYIFNQKYVVEALSSDGTDKGYKPSRYESGIFNTESFVVHGLPKSIFDQYRNSTGSDKIALLSKMQQFCKFKARIYVNQYGRVQAGGEISHPIKIIDPGYTLADSDDTIVFLDVGYHDQINTFSGSDWITDLQSVIVQVKLDNDKIDETDQSNFLVPEVHFPKRNLTIKASGAGGKLSKFWQHGNPGLGFNLYQTIRDPFQQIPFTAPNFILNFSGGKLISASLDLSSPTSGYSPNDTSIKVKFSRPFKYTVSNYPTDSLIQNGEIDDEYAKFRCIYLNDVPIRDHTGRFNYSKFHFDMRIGHFQNSTNQHPYNGILAPSASDQLLSPEFRVPTHTKFINYPLFGPRNEGEKDYYYSHTIKNPAVSDISFSIKINQLHYIYEGDESAVYLNLLPILGMVLGYMFGVWLAKKVISYIFPEFTISTGIGVSTGFSIPSFKSALEVVAQIAAYAAIQAGGILFAMLGFKWITKNFKCSKVPWLCIKIGELIKNSGEIWPAQIRFRIEYGIEGEELVHDTIEIRGCATSSYVKDIFINNLPSASTVGFNSEVKKNRILRVYRLTRELDPVVGGLAEARYKIDAELLAATEYVEGYFSYPNTAVVGTRLNSKDHPNIPKREYLIKGRLIRVPSNYNPVTGEYDGSWDGQFDPKLKWTSNPAWIIFDLLTDNRYGMGKYGVKDEDIDKWSFYKFAKRCDEMVNVIIDGHSTQERRHMCNLYIDSERQAYDYIRDLMNVYNSKINFSAGTIHIVQDAPAESGPIMLFNNSNVSEKGFSYSSTPETDRITAVTVDFIDERDNYMQKTEYVEDAEGIREHGYKHVKVAGIGITRRGEAHRLAWHKILTKQMEKEVIIFEAGIRASYLRIGDVIEVLDNSKVSEHSGGRIISIISSRTIQLDIPTAALGNATSLYIESPVQTYSEWAPNTTFLSGTTVIYLGHFYENKTGDNGSTPPNEDETNWDNIETVRQKQFKEYSISSKSNFNVTLSSNISSDIKEGFTWIVKENDSDKVKPRQYKIKQVKEISTLNYEVAATEHFEDKYNQIDNSTGAEKGIEFEDRAYYGPPISIA
jgi:predicted phage tail protein